MRLLHLADLHLDTPAPGRSDRIRRRLRAAVRESLRAAVDIALTEEVDAVVVAGDLFDGQRLSFDSERYLIQELVRLGDAGIRVVYATGNHDAPDSGSRALRLPWPENVTVVSRAEPLRVEVLDREGEPAGFITAAGHPTGRETRDLSARFPVPSQQRLPEVALLHTQVRRAESSDRHHPYAPSTLDGLLSRGYHCWLLGHVHRRQVLNGTPLVTYSGNPQGRTYNETGVRGVQLIDLTDPQAPRCEFRPTSRVRFETLPVSGLEHCESLDLLVGSVREAWEAARESDPDPAAEWLVRVELSGPCPLATELANPDDLTVLEDELGGTLGALDVTVWAGGVHAVVHIADHMDRDDVLGETLRLLDRLNSGEEALAAIDPGDLAGYTGSSAREREAYLRSLLDGLDVEAVSRLLDPTSGAGAGP